MTQSALAAGTGRCKRRGSSFTEFAVVAPLLFGLLLAAFSLGSGVSRLVLASSVCRNANVLMARGFDLAKTDNQRLVVQSAAGLGLAGGPGLAANPQGRAVIYLTKVVKLGVNTCAQGVPNWNGEVSACPNFQKYVIASRVAIGNSLRWQSATGSPVSPLNARGEVSKLDIAMTTGNRAANFSDQAGQPSIVRLFDDEVAYIAEVFVDAGDLRVPFLIPMDTIKVRNVS